MKYFFGVLFLLTISGSSYAQITIDSFAVYKTVLNVDSMNIKGKSDGQKISKVYMVPTNDGCGTLYVSLFFAGCGPVQSISYDTTFYYGYPTDRIVLSAYLDTLVSCPLPNLPTIMDSAYWDDCGPTAVAEYSDINTYMSVYPNPATNYLHIRYKKEISIKSIQLVSAVGQIVKVYVKSQNGLELTQNLSGVYFLLFDTELGKFNKRILIR